MEVRIDHGKDPIDKTVGYPLRHVLFYNPKQPDSKPKTVKNILQVSAVTKAGASYRSGCMFIAQDKAVNHTV